MFISILECLKVKKPLLGCEDLPKGPGELWDCKRDMVEQCLDENEDHYTQMGSEELVQFINDFEESEIVSENTRDYLERQAEQAKLMQNDVQFEPEPKIVTLDEKYQMNKKGKVRVGFVRKLKGEAKDNVDTTAFGSDAGAQAYLDSLKEAEEPVEQEAEEEVEEEAESQGEASEPATDAGSGKFNNQINWFETKQSSDFLFQRAVLATSTSADSTTSTLECRMTSPQKEKKKKKMLNLKRSKKNQKSNQPKREVIGVARRVPKAKNHRRRPRPHQRPYSPLPLPTAMGYEIFKVFKFL